jgi:hypothetical protein
MLDASDAFIVTIANDVGHGKTGSVASSGYRMRFSAMRALRRARTRVQARR